MNKRFVFASLFAFALVLFVPAFLSAAPDPGACGLIVGESVIYPGDKKEFIFSAFGVPERIYAMRGKGDKTKDYVKLYYQENDLSFDITNDDNTIRAILIKGDSKIKNVPFKVGETYDSVKAKWGEPDRKEAGFANYSKKGVMFKVSDAGIIEIIAVFLPGNMDSEPPSNEAVKS